MRSPFLQDRFEHIRAHIYYLPQELVEQLEAPKSCYIIGSRGSGKTTLLQSLNWKERIANDGLRAALEGDPFREGLIASYVKLPTMRVDSFASWLDDGDEDTSGLLFGLYIDLISVEMLADAFGGVFADFGVGPTGEESAVSSFLREHGDLLEPTAPSTASSVWDLAKLAKSCRRRLEHNATKRESVSTLLETLRIPNIGELSRDAAAMLCRLLLDAMPEKEWHFKLCMDEAECLSAFQQRVVNTLVRLVESPLSYVASFVGQPEDAFTTVHASLTQQRADRTVVVLDDLSKDQFKQFCNGVGTVRMRAESGDVAIEFDSEQTLGALNLNRLVHEMVARSESPYAKMLNGLAEQHKESPWASARAEGDSLPYIEAYLAHKLDLPLPSTADAKAARRQASAEFRKKIVAAYLSICREMKVAKIPLSSSDMLLGISDRCIRDFLSQMHHVFVLSSSSIADFTTHEVPSQVQSDAIHAASKEKAQSIPESGVLKPIQIDRLVRGLAFLTAYLQRGEVGSSRHLKASERGIYRLEAGAANENSTSLEELVREAAEAGFLKLSHQEDDRPTFRVHASLAPAFGFSYRGAYYASTLKREEVLALTLCEEDRTLSAKAAMIAKRLDKPDVDPMQKGLFGDEDSTSVDEVSP